MSPRFASPRESGPSPTGSFLRAPAATAAWGLAAALGLGALATNHWPQPTRGQWFVANDERPCRG